MHKEVVQVDTLRELVRNMKVSYLIAKIKGMRDCMNKHSIDEEEAICNEIRQWMHGYRVFVRNAPRETANILSDWVEI